VPPSTRGDYVYGHYVYIVRCADGTLYTGYARDPHARALAHNRGQGAKYTSGRRPVSLIHVERFRSKGKALRREHEIKQWPRERKEGLLGEGHGNL
jgi:predicted GIY-YIG superfamily endonuclease